jgi:hypothetical protein
MHPHIKGDIDLEVPFDDSLLQTGYPISGHGRPDIPRIAMLLFTMRKTIRPRISNKRPLLDGHNLPEAVDT